MGRLKPGWTVERAQAQLAAISPAIFQATVAATLQRRDRKELHWPSRSPRRPAATGVSGLRTRLRDAAVGAARRDRPRAADHLRQPREPDARARHRARARDRRPPRDRRVAPPHRPADALREPVDRGVRRARRACCWRSGSARRWSRSSAPTAAGCSSTSSPDWRVFAFIAGIAVLACLLFGLSPALKATGTNPAQAMQAGGRSSDATRTNGSRCGADWSSCRSRCRWCWSSARCSSAAACRNLVTLDPGFRQDGILAVNVDVRRSRHRPRRHWQQRFAQVMERVRTVPGVSLGRRGVHRADERLRLEPERRDRRRRRRKASSTSTASGADYFRDDGDAADRRPHVRSRGSAGRDRDRDRQRVVRRSATSAATNPIGAAFQIEASPGQPQPHYQIVGLVKDTKYTDLREDFTPIALPRGRAGDRSRPFLDLVLRIGHAAAVADARADPRHPGGGAGLDGRLRQLSGPTCATRS